ncbi:MAG: hypothetical protein RIA38_02480 [Microcella pacifica]
MFRSVIVGSALTTVLLVIVPIFGGTSGEAAGVASSNAGAASSSPVISGIETRGSADESSIQIIEMVERSANDADDEDADDDSRDSDTEHSAQKPVAVSTSSGSNGSSSGSSGGPAAGSSAGGSSSTGSSSGGSSSGGSSGGSGSSEPPAAPKPPPAPEPPACPAAIGGSAGGAPGATSAGGVAGTTSSDLASFAARYNEIRVANCLPPVPFGNIRYDSCMEQRLFWMAEDPSTDPMSAWGHIGSQRSDGVPSVGCDGNLAGGSGNTGATVADKWWASSGHRASLYKPGNTGSMAGTCILFAMTHGGVPNEPYSFTRAAARWVNC